ncbi:MAG: putative membrane protein [Arenicella sp.]|jgi:uncharacterized membrane protein
MVLALLSLRTSQLLAGYIKRTVRHPMLLAVVLWPVAHLGDGADLPQAALFGSFLIYSLVDLVAVTERKKADHNPAQKPHWRNDLFTVLVAGLMYAILVNGVHEWLFGVSPLVLT